MIKYALCTALLTLAAPAQAQHHDQTFVAAGNDGFGIVSMPNSGNAAAQAPFRRGLALLHDFEYPSAAAAFREAQAADPGFVLAYWGEAMTANHPLWAEQDLAAGRAVLAKLGSDPAARRAKARDAREAQWLDAIETLYGEGDKQARDRAYADRMKALFDADPAEIDARSFYALSVMGTAGHGRDIPTYMRAAAILEEAFPAHSDHPGVVHYLIHAYDDPAHAPLGERAAARYAIIAPNAGHAQHMVSHIYLALGRWPEVESANVKAVQVVNDARTAKGRPPSYCGHYPEWEVYAILQQGRDASQLIGQCRDAASAELARGEVTSVLGDGRSDVNSWSDMVLRQAVETGTLPELLAIPADRFALARFNLAYAHLLAARHNGPAARQALADLKRERQIIAAALPREMPDEHELGPWLERTVAQGGAIAAVAAGESERGLSLLKAAIAAEAALPVPFGPPVLAKPSAELLGEEYLALGRKADAAEAFRQALAAAPNRRLSATGLASVSAQ